MRDGMRQVKGGNIKRLAACFDPRGYNVIPPQPLMLMKQAITISGVLAASAQERTYCLFLIVHGTAGL